MSCAVQSNLRNVNAIGNNLMYVSVPLVFTGSYSTGGDVMSIVPVIADLPTQEVVEIEINASSSNALANSFLGGFYVPVGQPGPFGGVNNINAVTATLPASWKCKIFVNSAGSTTELGAGAYGTVITTDYAMLWLTLRRLGSL